MCYIPLRIHPLSALLLAPPAVKDWEKNSINIFSKLGRSPSMALFKSKVHNDQIDPMLNYPDFLEWQTERRRCPAGKKKKRKKRNMPLSFLWNQDRGHHQQTKQWLVFTVELHPWRQRRGSSALAEREWICAEEEGTRPISALSCYWSSGWRAITV